MSKVQTGTDDGGMAPGRKVKSFIWMTAGVLACVFMTTKIHTPDNVAIQALWTIGVGGLFVVGGQSLVDLFEKIAMGKLGQTTNTTVNKLEITEHK